MLKKCSSSCIVAKVDKTEDCLTCGKTWQTDEPPKDQDCPYYGSTLLGQLALYLIVVLVFIIILLLGELIYG